MGELLRARYRSEREPSLRTLSQCCSNVTMWNGVVAIIKMLRDMRLVQAGPSLYERGDVRYVLVVTFPVAFYEALAVRPETAFFF